MSDEAKRIVDLRSLRHESRFSPIDFWNRRCESCVTEDERKHQKFLEFVLNDVPSRVELACLVGCDCCDELVYFHRFASRYVCCDISDVAIARATSRWCWTNSVSFRVCKPDEPLDGVAGASFDLIVTSSLFKHVRSPFAESIVANFVRTLKSGGKYVCIEPTFTTDRLKTILDEDVRWHMSYRTAEDFVDLITNGTGFKKLNNKGSFYSFVLE